ncbi:hypothetical protein E2C01_065452 [Portunus trituberculatus]|uniref:Uncharacterized protein n=1 Tax=Portunus trituberculatus TaxID=210409 RepID=A0A5B7HFM8_PORTR|nr:hypothetical protein [Portunus trituberculatus]
MGTLYCILHSSPLQGNSTLVIPAAPPSPHATQACLKTMDGFREGNPRFLEVPCDSVMSRCGSSSHSCRRQYL